MERSDWSSRLTRNLLLGVAALLVAARARFKLLGDRAALGMGSIRKSAFGTL
jgi:hypothetical protein